METETILNVTPQLPGVRAGPQNGEGAEKVQSSEGRNKSSHLRRAGGRETPFSLGRDPLG